MNSEEGAIQMSQIQNSRSATHRNRILEIDIQIQHSISHAEHYKRSGVANEQFGKRRFEESDEQEGFQNLDFLEIDF